MLLNDKLVQYDDMYPELLDAPEEQKSMLIIQAQRDVLHKQIVKGDGYSKECRY